jgi:ribosomal protein L6P/L9E
MSDTKAKREARVRRHARVRRKVSGKPEPYKGKGIRYENEVVKKKAGKAAKGSA